MLLSFKNSKSTLIFIFHIFFYSTVSFPIFSFQIQISRIVQNHKSMIHCFFLISRHGRSRLTKWYSSNLTQQQKQRFLKQVNQLVITRKPKMCNFVDYKDYKIVYKRYASLYFITIVDKADNELLILELIHTFVEVLDKYFGNVCELDLIFNFHKTYFILDELLIAGYITESNRKLILKDLQHHKQIFDDKDADKDKKK